MPTYEYRPTEEDTGCDACRDGLDVLQQMSEAPLEKCPECGVAIARSLTAPGVNTRLSEKAQMSDSNLKRLGFKKFVRDEGGYTQTV